MLVQLRKNLPGAEKNLIFDDGIQGVQRVFRGFPAQGNAERSIDGFGGDVHGGEDMAAVAFGAGGTGADADAVILQNVDGVLGGHAGDGDGENVGRFVGAVDADAFQPGELFRKAVQHGLF